MHTMHQQRGFTLIEVLVSILILSIGVLGAAGMQFAAMKSNKESRNQDVGVRFAQELADKMRANHLVLTSATNPYVTDWKSSDGVPSASVDCANNTCTTATDVAQWDLYDVIQRITQPNGLPSARLVVCRDANPYDANGVPQWGCSGAGTLFIKMGWTQSSFNSSDSATSPSKGLVLATDDASHPALIYPVE